MKLPGQKSRLQRTRKQARASLSHSHVHIPKTDAESQPSGGSHRLGIHLASLKASLHQKSNVPKKHRCTLGKRVFFCHPNAIFKTSLCSHRDFPPPEGITRATTDEFIRRKAELCGSSFQKLGKERNATEDALFAQL